jgi:hypothetical protein
MITGACIGFLICFVLWLFSDGVNMRDMLLNFAAFTAAGTAAGYLWSVW